MMERHRNQVVSRSGREKTSTSDSLWLRQPLSKQHGTWARQCFTRVKGKKKKKKKITFSLAVFLVQPQPSSSGDENWELVCDSTGHFHRLTGAAGPQQRLFGHSSAAHWCSATPTSPSPAFWSLPTAVSGFCSQNVPQTWTSPACNSLLTLVALGAEHLPPHQEQEDNVWMCMQTSTVINNRQGAFMQVPPFQDTWLSEPSIYILV